MSLSLFKLVQSKIVSILQIEETDGVPFIRLGVLKALNKPSTGNESGRFHRCQLIHHRKSISYLSWRSHGGNVINFSLIDVHIHDLVQDTLTTSSSNRFISTSSDVLFHAKCTPIPNQMS